MSTRDVTGSEAARRWGENMVKLRPTAPNASLTSVGGEGPIIAAVKVSPVVTGRTRTHSAVSAGMGKQNSNQSKRVAKQHAKQ